jgi:SEC-C motif domain protein
VASTPEALMRSRYAAFALGLGEYLADTPASSHPDRKHPREELVGALVRSRSGQRFLGLTILHTSTDGDQGEVLFHARIFEKGEDQSFAELSRFVREDGSFRYLDGLLVEGARLPPLQALDRASFLALAQP